MLDLIAALATYKRRPYRFPESAVVDVCYPDDINTVLAASTAPAVRVARSRLVD